MELRIIDDRENPLLERREVWFEVEHRGKPTPPKLEVAKLLAAKLNAKLDLMVIRHYTTKFGTNVSRGLCLIYANPEAMIRAEPVKLLNARKRIGMKEGGEGGEAQQEQQVEQVQG